MAKSSKQWLRRHVTDHYVKRAKQQGYRSRAAFKLLEIDKKESILKPGMTVLDLGAAPGSWSQVAAEKVKPGGRVIAVDVLDMAPVPGVAFLRGDICQPGLRIPLAQTLSDKADVVLADMSPNLSGIANVDQMRASELVQAGMSLCRHHLKPEGALLIKVFQGDSLDELRNQVKRTFRTVKVCKPSASRSESREIYLVARGFRTS